MAQTRPDIPGDSVPKPRPNSEPGTVKLTREDRQVLARIDGNQNVDAIARKTGLDMSKVQGILRFLLERRLIEVPGYAAVTATGSRPAMSDSSGSRPAASQSGARPSVATTGPRPATGGTLPERLMRPLPKGDDLIPLVEELFVSLETVSYYDLLGVKRQTRGDELKKAYILRTKSFHPDRFYRRADADFKLKLQEIFKQVVKGYKVLADDEQRNAYDASLVKEQKKPEEEVSVKFSPVSSERVVMGGAERPFEKVRPAAPQKIAMEAASDKEVEAGVSTPKTAPVKLKLGLKPGEKKLPDYIEKAIKERAKDQQATSTQAERFFQGAMIERDRGNFAAAKVNLKLAMQYAPFEAKYKKAMEELDKFEESRKAELEFRAGVDAHAEGDLRGAAGHYRQALQFGYENAKLYHKFADLVIELDANFERARAFCLKAIELQPGVADFHLTLARAYKGLGQKAAAIVQLEKVLALDPKNKLVAKELKALKRS